MGAILSSAKEVNNIRTDTTTIWTKNISDNNQVLRKSLLDQLASLKGEYASNFDSLKEELGTDTSAGTTTTTAASNKVGTKKVHGSDIVASLFMTLLELGVTLTASYFFGKLLARAVSPQLGRGGDASDEFRADNGNSGGAKGVMKRLQNLLVARHEATLKAMMEELEEHQLQWNEEKKEDDNEEDDETKLEKIQTKRQYNQLQTELQIQHEQTLSTLESLSPYEMNIAQSNVIDPANLSVTFSDVGGMDDIKSEIYDLVVMPLMRPDLFMSDSGLVSPPKGILLYGPPGTGKTMLAKAIAKESHATFVNVQLSTIMNKWFGESNKLISATFQVARKLAPSVVFIDEIDAFLSRRDNTEGAAVSSMKSEFLTLWDGLLSERKGNVKVEIEVKGGVKEEVDVPSMLPTPPIIVLGATNRPYEVDAAILRRLPRSFEVPLPNLESRLQLLRLFLKKQNMTKEAQDYLPTLAKKTVGYSGSDLKELCRAAAWEPVREMTSGASKRAVGVNRDDASTPTLKRTSSGFPRRGTKARPVTENDLTLALSKVKKTGESAQDFHAKDFVRGRNERQSMAAKVKKTGGAGMANVDLQNMMAMAMQAAASMNNSSGEQAVPELADDDEVPNVL